MNKNVTNIRVSIDITAHYGLFHIKLTNTHGRKLLYEVMEQISPKEGWTRLPFSASKYILHDFKQTKEHQEMIDILTVATKKYGY